jgi:hypothetical protein
LSKQQAFAPTHTVQRVISSKLQFVATFPRTKLKGFEQIRAKPLGYPHYLIFLHPHFLTTLSVHGDPKIIRHIPTLRKRVEKQICNKLPGIGSSLEENKNTYVNTQRKRVKTTRKETKKKIERK